MKVDLYEKKFDLDELLYKIEMFEMIKGELPNYVVMKEQTADAIESQYRPHYAERCACYFKHNKRYISEVFGIPIAYNELLPFGIVEVV